MGLWRHDSRQKRGVTRYAAADQIAPGHQYAVNASGNGRGNTGPGEFKARCGDGGFGRLHLRLSRITRGGDIVSVFT